MVRWSEETETYEGELHTINYQNTAQCEPRSATERANRMKHLNIIVKKFFFI